MSKLVRAAPLVVAAAALLVWGYQRGRKEADQQDRPIQAPARVSVAPSGEVTVTLDASTQARIDLKTEAVQTRAVRPWLLAYGSLQEDPACGFTIRAPVAGTLRQSPGAAWPSLGQTVAAGRVVGSLEPRLAPVDRLSIKERLAAAQADQEALTATLAASRAVYDRARLLNADDKNVSDRALQDAEARMKSDEARLQAAQQSVAMLRSALEAGPVLLLVAQVGGQVVEVAVQPNEAIEAGQTVLRLMRFDELLATVNVPAGETIGPSAAARIVVAGHEDHPLAGVRVAFGAAVDVRTQGQAFVYRVRADGFALRPGMAVTAYLEQSGAAAPAAVLPRDAVLRYAGGDWVYIETAPDKFVRRPIALTRPVEDGWLTTSLRGGERVVITGGELLLSEEMKSQIQVGEAAEAR